MDPFHPGPFRPACRLALFLALFAGATAPNASTSIRVRLAALSCSQSSILGPGSDACTVQLTAAAGNGGLAVGLGSNNRAVNVPGSVTVPAGATSAGFTATVSAVNTAQTATLTAAAGGATQTYSIRLRAYVPGLQLSTTRLNFGSVTVNTTSAAQSVTLTSSGTAPLTINSAALSGAGFSMSGASFPVTMNPGQSATLSVAFGPTVTGSTSGSITVRDNASPSTAMISLSGTGQAAAGTLSALSCSQSSITGSGSDACTVSLTAPAAKGGLAVGLSSSNSAVSVPGSVTVPAGATSAGFTATVSAVTTAQTANLTASAGAATQTYNIGLGAYVAGLQLSTSSLDFGSITVNTSSAPLPVTLTSSGTAPLTIHSAALSGAGFSMSGATFPVTLNPGQSATLSVAFGPTATGSASGSITVSDNASPSTATISLSGTGQAAAGTLNALSCSQSSITGSGSDACTVSLSAPAAPGGLAVSLSSDNSAVTVPGSVTVPAGATSAGFTATVSAVTTEETAILTASAGAATQTYNIGLGAAAPTLTLGATTVPFGSVDLKTSATQSVSLTSTGTATLIISSGSVTGTGFSISGLSFPVTLNPGQTATLYVGFDPTTAGEATGTVLLTSNASPSTATISLTGTGTSPQSEQNYSTSFPLTENPISENGNWTVPSESGDSSLWSNIATGSAHAYGQAMPTTYGDPSASLTGTWGPNQTVTGTVFINGSLTGVHEDELRLRQTIEPNSLTGYELLVSLDPRNPYAQIVRWNGANGHFCTGAADTRTHAVNGDVLKGTITGTNPTTITFYLNGTQILQWVDNGAGPGNCGSEANYGPWQTGTPGIGFYNGGSDWSSFGFSNFTATDGDSLP